MGFPPKKEIQNFDETFLINQVHLQGKPLYVIEFKL